MTRWMLVMLTTIAAIVQWMHVNGESIRGTSAGPFDELEWGRCTVRRAESKSTLYFHVYDWKRAGPFRAPGLGSLVVSARLLGDDRPVEVDRFSTGIEFSLPSLPPETRVPVVAVEIEGQPIVYNKPRFDIGSDIFVDVLEVRLDPAPPGAEIRYTTNGSGPDADSPVADGPITIERSCLVTARYFVEGRAVSDRAHRVVRRVDPNAGRHGAVENLPLGLARERFRGTWDRLPEFDNLRPDVEDRVSVISPEQHVEHEAWRITGWMRIDETGVYRVLLRSDDGSRLTIDDEILIANDGLHAAREFDGTVALGEGWHPIKIEWFNKTGGADLRVRMGLVGEEPAEIAQDRLRQRD